MKRFLTILTVLFLSLVTLTACSKPAEPQPSETTEPTAAPEASEAPASASCEELAGTYVDSVAGRGVLTLTAVEDGADISVSWSSSAAAHSEWTMHAVYDADKKQLDYKDAKMETIVFNDDGTEKSRETGYTDGKGSFLVTEEGLEWKDGMGDIAEGTLFVAEEDYAPGMPNPWTETEDAAKAAEIAGFEMDLPVEEALPEGMKFWKYICMEGVYGGLYEGHDDEMLIRKSNVVDAEELSGDFNNYSKSWNYSHKGLTVNCLGDGTLINNASFSFGGFNYVILFNAGQEGHGLTEDQMNSLITSIQ
ncbi:MAG: hypothetical protein IKE21_08780 [Erysipelotrichaceae bacterium]|nr:hypothetical protein [Erysipelotrichaceae bacterium]